MSECTCEYVKAVRFFSSPNISEPPGYLHRIRCEACRKRERRGRGWGISALRPRETEVVSPDCKSTIDK